MLHIILYYYLKSVRSSKRESTPCLDTEWLAGQLTPTPTFLSNKLYIKIPLQEGPEIIVAADGPIKVREEREILGGGQRFSGPHGPPGPDGKDGNPGVQVFW